MKLQIKKGTTSKLLDIFIQDSSLTTGAGLTGLTYSSSGLTAYYYREGAASAVAITLATMTLGTWATGGFVVIDGTNMPGCYQLSIPDASLLTGANSVVILLKGATNMAPLVLEIELVDNLVSDVKTVADTIAVDVAGLDGAAMRGTDNAALASVCTEGRLSELDTANLPTDIANIKTDTAAVLDDTGTSGVLVAPNGTLIADVWAYTTRILTAGTNIVLVKGTGITGLNDLSAAQINTEVVDTLNVDTYAEPGQEAPAATTTLVAKIGYLYKFLRNRITQTSTQMSVYADNGTTVDQKSTVSDNGTTFDRNEIGSGP